MTNITPISSVSIETKAPQKTERDEKIYAQAKEFEAVFVAQMLKYGGLPKAIAGDGGPGGDAFSSMMVEQYAERIVEKGGFGLAGKIYEQLKEQENGHGK